MFSFSSVFVNGFFFFNDLLERVFFSFTYVPLERDTLLDWSFSHCFSALVPWTPALWSKVVFRDSKDHFGFFTPIIFMSITCILLRPSDSRLSMWPESSYTGDEIKGLSFRNRETIQKSEFIYGCFFWCQRQSNEIPWLVWCPTIVYPCTQQQNRRGHKRKHVLFTKSFCFDRNRFNAVMPVVM